MLAASVFVDPTLPIRVDRASSVSLSSSAAAESSSSGIFIKPLFPPAASQSSQFATRAVRNSTLLLDFWDREFPAERTSLRFTYSACRSRRTAAAAETRTCRREIAGHFHELTPPSLRADVVSSRRILHSYSVEQRNGCRVA